MGLCQKPMVGGGLDDCRFTDERSGWLCVDFGAVLGLDPGFAFVNSPPDLTALLVENGAPEHIRYSDYSRWTGQEIPVAPGCPDSAAPLCGGDCSPCDGVCRGRSPTHPYGVCWANNQLPEDICTRANPACPDGRACIVLTVGGEEQVNSDADGFCIPVDECAAVAADLPGGAECLAP